MKLEEYERLDDLQRDGLFIIQDTRGFCYGTDAVLLSDFADIARGQRVIDLCTGNGIVALLLHAKCEAEHITGLEIMPDAAGRAKRSVEYNKIKNIDIVTGDLKNAAELFGCEKFDAVTCNPPYEKIGGGKFSPNDRKAVSRHELLCTLSDVVKSSASLLRYGGKLFMVHRANRLTDVICTMRKHGIEPKRLRLVAPCQGKEPNLILVEGAKGGGSFMRVMPTLYIYEKNGEYTDEIHRIYAGEGAKG